MVTPSFNRACYLKCLFTNLFLKSFNDRLVIFYDILNLEGAAEDAQPFSQKKVSLDCSIERFNRVVGVPEAWWSMVDHPLIVP